MVPAEPEKQNLLVGGAAKAAGQAAHSVKAVAQEIAPQSQTSQPPAEYGQEKVEAAARNSLDTAGNVSWESARLTYRKFRILQAKRAKLQLPEHTAADQVVNAESGGLDSRPPPSRAQKLRKKQMETLARRRLSTRRDSPLSPLRQRFVRQEAVQRYMAKGAGARRGTSASLKAPATPGKRAARQRLQHAAQVAWQKICRLVVQSSKMIVQALAALLGAGGVVALAVVLFGVIAVFFSSPFGILFADQTGDPGSFSIQSIVQETNAEMDQAIQDEITAHPECDRVEAHCQNKENQSWTWYWPEVLALFAVDMNLHEQTDLLVIDARKKDKLQDMFWRMHRIESEVEEVETTPPSNTGSTNSSSASSTPTPPQVSYTLHVTIHSRPVEDLATELRFTEDERAALRILLSDEMRSGLEGLITG